MERRLGRVIESSAGGTASKNAKTYKLALPSSWVAELKLDAKGSQVELHFDGSSIHIIPRLSLAEYIRSRKKLGHELLLLFYYDSETLCSVICADYTEMDLCCENHTQDFLHTAFGSMPLPGWEDYLRFLEDRCVPRARDGLRHYLDALGLDEYEPLEIIKKTQGRMAGDEQWLKLEEVL